MTREEYHRDYKLRRRIVNDYGSELISYAELHKKHFKGGCSDEFLEIEILEARDQLIRKGYSLDEGRGGGEAMASLLHEIENHFLLAATWKAI